MSEKSEVDHLLDKLKNHKVLSLMVVVAVVIIGLANVTEAIEKLSQFGRSIYSSGKPPAGGNDLDTVVQLISKSKEGGYEAAYKALREFLENE